MAVFYNRATLSYGGTTTNSNVTTGEILEALTVTKSVLSDSYVAGEPVDYAISIVNSGSAPVTDVTVTDNLGEYSFSETEARIPLDFEDGSVYAFSDGTLLPTPTVTAADGLEISGLTVPASGNLLLLYSAVPNEYAPLSAGSSIINTAEVTSSSIAAPISASAALLVSDEPILSITKSLSPLSVEENGTITYTFVIENTGNAPAQESDNLVITDTFNPALSEISVTYNGAPWTEYTYSEATGLFTTNAGQITVPEATILQDSVSGAVTVTPGTATVTVTGTL